MQLNPYLLFNGQCEEAFKFYERTLAAKIDCLLFHEGTPAEKAVSAEWSKKVLHGRLNINGQVIMASDCPPERWAKPQGFSVNLNFQTPDEAERVYRAFEEGGQVTMPFGETFWAERFGMVTDRYGIPWMINCEKARMDLPQMENCTVAAR
jgi:PhnB protein